MGRLGLNHPFTAGAGQTWTLDLNNLVMARHIFQFFHHIRSQLLKAATAVFAGLTGCEGLFDPFEPLWERLAFARRLWGVCLGRCFVLTVTFRLCGLFDLKLFEYQFQRQLRAAF